MFVYFIEAHPRFGALAAKLFESIDAGEIQGVTSALTLLETLVVRYRAGDLELAARYEAVLTRSRGLSMLDLDRSFLKSAAWGGPAARPQPSSADARGP